jgi:hypothetical protein
MNNCRVLIYNNIPTGNHASADVVVGQPDFTSNTANNGGLGANTLTDITGLTTAHGSLFVSDCSNHRVLIFNSIPVSNYASADAVLGQPNLTSGISNNGGVSAASLNFPLGIRASGNKLWVADYSNTRVLQYDDSTPSNTPTATPTCSPTYPATPTRTSTPVQASSTVSTITIPDEPFFKIQHPVVRNTSGDQARIKVNVTQSGYGRLRIFDVTGRKVATLWDAPLAAGAHEIAWDGQGVGSGLYYAHFEFAGQTASGRIVIIR